jgi:hypothetical protein
MKKVTLLQLLVVFVFVLAAIGSLTLSVMTGKIEPFYQTMAGGVGCLFVSYFLGVWD